jgi:hypothetical protein
MPNQDVIDQAAKLTTERPAEAAPDTATVTPPRYNFNDFDEFRLTSLKTSAPRWKARASAGPCPARVPLDRMA